MFAALSLGRRNLLPALIVGLAVLALTSSPVLRPSAAPSAEAVFPTRIAPYSWWTGGLSSARLDAALLLYQNGVGVEFMDFPQAVLLGTDGSSYRRFEVAEWLTIAADQGDPAESVLSPDGTFAVVAGADGQGSVRVVTLRDGSERVLPVGAGMSAVPVSIGADGRSVLVVTSDHTLSPLQDYNFRLHGGLARLDLASGQLRSYAELTDVHAAALSPDGTRLLADTGSGLLLASAADGSVLARVSVPGPVQLDGDAWSPDGGRIALMSGSSLVIVDMDRPADVHSLPLSGIDYGDAIGWRDAHTVLVEAATDGDDNNAEFLWVDVNTGQEEPFSSYSPNFTGAAMGNTDIARNLVPNLQVQSRPIGRGPLPLPLSVLLGLVSGAIAFAVTPKRKPAPTDERIPLGVA